MEHVIHQVKRKFKYSKKCCSYLLFYSYCFLAVWQIVCDDNMIFRDILVGWPGSVHDARVLRNSSLSATAATKFPGNTHLLGDGGYPLKRFPFTQYFVALDFF